MVDPRASRIQNLHNFTPCRSYENFPIWRTSKWWNFKGSKMYMNPPGTISILRIHLSKRSIPFTSLRPRSNIQHIMDDLEYKCADTLETIWVNNTSFSLNSNSNKGVSGLRLHFLAFFPDRLEKNCGEISFSKAGKHHLQAF